jgi:transposase InsO family protein
MSLEQRERAETEVRRLEKLTALPLAALLKYAGISERTWREWKGRQGAETGHNNNIPRNYYLTPEETAAIIGYCGENEMKGYRMLCWEMVDKNIACVSASSVYNVIKRHNLDKKWEEAIELAKKGFEQPKAVHQQWHTDFSYIRIGGAFYYFLSMLEGFSRRVLNWRLCQDMKGLNAELLLAETKELYPDAKTPRIISDNGSQFISKDFEELVALLEFEHTRTSANHPQSNGKLERFHKTFKSEHVRRTAYTSYDDARVRMAHWIAYYNSERLHSAIWYLTPDDVFYGRTSERLAVRKEKLHTACIKRREYWQTIYAAP